MTIRPCIYPGCDRDNGDPALTAHGACEPCQHRYRRTIQNLVTYWAILHTTLPAPTAKPTPAAKKTRKSYGHPAEWASDTAADIAAKLNWTHDALAEHLHDTPPPHDHAPEHTRIRHAYRYLEPRIQQLVTMPGAQDAAEELAELHHKTRAALGQTRQRVWLKGVPCMACTTPALALIDDDHVECGACDWTSSRQNLGLLARHAIDAMIDAYDQQHADTQTRGEVA